MPNPTQADVARPGCSARGRHGDFRGAVVKEIRQSGAGEWVGTLGARADINVLSPSKVRQA